MNLIERNFINRFCEELEKINGTEFEYLCSPVMSLIVKELVHHKGHNLCAKPVGYTADFLTTEFTVIGQCGTDPDYFEDQTKPIHDIERAMALHGQCTEINLFANRRSTGGQLTNLDKEIKSKNLTIVVHTYDAEKIASVVLSNIQSTAQVEAIMEYLPTTKQYLDILPASNQLPSLKTDYVVRSDDESLIKQIIQKQNYVQIFGVSGIGKSDLSISIAQSLKDQFDTILWLDGQDLINAKFDLQSIALSKFGSNINLNFVLSQHHILLIVDNLNENVDSFVQGFQNANRNKSLCIVTSLQKNLPEETSYNLSYLTDELSKQVLLSGSNIPTEEQIANIISLVKGYPLLLTILKSSVEVGDFSWHEIITEIQNVVSIEDERNQKISERVIGRFLPAMRYDLSWLGELDNIRVSRNFLDFVIGKMEGVRSLAKRSLITIRDGYYYNVHQLIIDAVKDIVPMEDDLTKRVNALSTYLNRYNETKSLEYYIFMLNHTSFLNKIYKQPGIEAEVKKRILYGFMQSHDYYQDPTWVLEQVIALAIKPKENYYDLLLFIEKSEIELHQTVKKEYHTKSMQIVADLQSFLPSAHDTVIYHHVGKMYAKTQQFDLAKENFEKILATDPDADYCLLQMARMQIKSGEFDTARKTISQVLDKEINLKEQSLSVLLSMYDLLANREFADLRKKYIDERADFFLSTMLYAIDKNFDQPYRLLEKLSGHLSYKCTDVYETLCQAIPFPAKLDSNKPLRLAYATIQADYYKLLKYAPGDGKDLKMKQAFELAEKYYLSIDFDNDINRKKLQDLYITGEQADKALDQLKEFDDPNAHFVQQNICKAYRLLQKYPESLQAIEIALQNDEELKPFHKAAFLNDKAMTLFDMQDPSCISVLEEAIKLQSDSKTQKTWDQKRGTWKTHFGIT